DPDFKEDSVREELLVPMIKALGYAPVGDAKVIRSKALVHPYVSIGSQPRKVSIIPDYVFMSGGKALWVLDAKAPSEDVVKSSHVEQAYSYAIHPEIRAELYALCNGHEFVLYEIRKFDPILRIKLSEMDSHWDKLYRILNSAARGNPELVDYAPDFGIYLRRIGADSSTRFIAPFCKSCFISRVEDDKYTTITAIPGDVEMAMSLDFNQAQLDQLLSFQSNELAAFTRSALMRQPYHVALDPSVAEFDFGVIALPAKDVEHNAEESYIPFVVTNFTAPIGFDGE
ncbi:type I restriction enzyme HsdR N-terminal domain-containing protein, partial [Xanthomonas phaseoli]|uniref:type I restriction enzyme HsdR N-terminal domain-containing protein n=1 Tax=Xanthomonas phaseoli TaxID=1985254 RepID=UPI001E435554